MNALIKPDGRIDFGIIEKPIHVVNYMDYILETPMGFRVSRITKSLRFNQFNFIGIMGPDIMAGLAVVDLNMVGNGFFYIYDRKNKTLVETKKIAPPFCASIKTNPSNMDSRFSFGGLQISFQGNKIKARGKDISLDAELDLNGLNPLRLCTRAGYRGWVYTEKTTPVSISGTMTCKGKSWNLSSPENLALVDWSAGFMRRNTFWNWAAIAATLPCGRCFGLNLASGVNETGFTENAVWIDNTMVKVDTVNFIFDPDDLMKPWKITSYDKKINLEFLPENKRDEKTNALILASRFTQLMGCYSGTITTDLGETIVIPSLPGYAEDHYAKW